MSSQIGPLVVPRELEEAVKNTIRTWVYGYLNEIAFTRNRTTVLPGFRSYNIRPTGDHWPGEQLPACIVVNAGIESIESSGDGQVECVYRLGVIMIAEADNQDSVRQNIGDYTIAVAALLDQQRGSTGASSVVLDTASFDEGPDEATRSIGGGTVEFLMRVPAYNRRRRLAVPLPEPPDRTPTGGTVPSVVEHTFLDVDMEDAQ